ncbi:DUF4494 family protein [Spirosoma endbachense]|uniref:DUF4494 domain-containing protein n=1 Tax=Spirosoma endbachense TaxID=2666025 RepID=A0A6P1VTA1_9BACT|nr:DUF4494 family protein [Spirosoma endbachense]QHV96323.1 DUF4494 domain-containing protein [Spirosoma endbachense]
MAIWYKSKIKYSALVDGEAKPQNETYLHEAINYGEVETQCPDILKTRIKTFDEDTVDTIGKIKFAEVIFHPMQEEDAFWQVKVTVFDEKKRAWTCLVAALDYIEAGQRVCDYLKGSLLPYEIADVKKSDILAVWHPKNELWQGDWWNRMERMYDEGKKEVGHNQLDIDFNKNADEDEDENDDQPNYGYAQRGNQLHDELTKLGFNKRSPK